MAEGCDCKRFCLGCKHEPDQDSAQPTYDSRCQFQGDTKPQVSTETIPDSQDVKQKKCESNGAKGEDDKSSNLSKVNSRSCPDLMDLQPNPGQAIRPRSVTFGRLTKKLGRRKSWKFFRNSQENNSDGEDKKEETKKRKERKLQRKRSTENNRNERQTSTSACGGVPPMFRLRAETTESRGTRTRRSRAQRVSVFDKFKRLFESDSNVRDNSNVSMEEVQRSPPSTQDLVENFPSSLDSPRRIPTAGPEHLAFIDKLVREENLHFFDEETQQIWRERTSMECFLPPDILSVTNCPYYWGAINRYQAEKELEDYPDGMYLLRDSAQYHYLYSVSFRRYKRTYHARIEQWRHHYSFDKPSEYSFYSRSVCELLQHYSKAEHCMFYEPMLIKPLPRKKTLPLQALCRAAICSRTTFSGVDQLPLPKSLKNYLREYHYKVPVKKTSDKGTQTQDVPKNRRAFGASWWI